MTNAFATLVSIDGWRNGSGGWDWNDQHKLREYSRGELEPVLGEHDKNRPRRIFAFLRAEGYLSDKSKGRVRLDVSGSDPDYLTIEDKNTGEPIFAFIVDWSEAEYEDDPVSAATTLNPAALVEAAENGAALGMCDED